MTQHPKNFYRIDPGVSGIAENLAKLRVNDAVVIAPWNETYGQVLALGIVTYANGDPEDLRIQYRSPRTELNLVPTSSGAVQWRTRPFFRFEDSVASRYALSTHFAVTFGIEDEPVIEWVAS